MHTIKSRTGKYFSLHDSAWWIGLIRANKIPTISWWRTGIDSSINECEPGINELWAIKLWYVPIVLSTPYSIYWPHLLSGSQQISKTGTWTWTWNCDVPNSRVPCRPSRGALNTGSPRLADFCASARNTQHTSQDREGGSDIIPNH